MLSKFTPSAQNAIREAIVCAKELGHTYIGSEHLLLGILSQKDAAATRLLQAKEITAEKMKTLLQDFIGCGVPTSLCADNLTPRARHILEIAASQAFQYGQSRIATEHLLYAILKESDCSAVRFLAAQGVYPKDLLSDLLSFLESFASPSPSASEAVSPKRTETKNPTKSNSPYPTILQYGRDLTQHVPSDPVIGRKEETERVIRILCRKSKNNPCLIGEPGVGKTAIVEGLAQRIAKQNVPEPLLGKKIIMLDLCAMVAGAKYRGEFEERMKNVIAEAVKHPSLILFIDELHTLIGAGAAEGAVDAANILKPALARAEIQIIGATTITEFRKNIERDAALERRFQSVMVGEPTKEQAMEILQGLKESYEAHHKIKISQNAMEAAVQLSIRYLNDRFLPDKAIDLIDEAAAALRIRRDTPPFALLALEEEIKEEERKKEAAIRCQDFDSAARHCDQQKVLEEKKAQATERWILEKKTQCDEISEADVAKIVTAWTGIPVLQQEKGENERLLQLESLLHQRVVGQEHAISAICRAVRRARVGLQDPNRPYGSFLFLGPSGVGKTEIAKALAELLFGTEQALIRLDMSEYMEKHSVSKLIGSPPGYIGHEEGGQLTEKLRRHPYCVLLFDEVEKAHPDVFHLLLQMLEDGILTDAQGRCIHCKNVILILTSNIGAQVIAQGKSAVGFRSAQDEESVKEKIEPQLKETFRPEFLNRLDEIVYFSKLSTKEMEEIAARLLSKTQARIAALGMEVHFSCDVASWFVKHYANASFGARPLRNALRKELEDPLAQGILEGVYRMQSVIEICVDKDALVFTSLQKKPSLAAQN